MTSLHFLTFSLIITARVPFLLLHTRTSNEYNLCFRICSLGPGPDA